MCRAPCRRSKSALWAAALTCLARYILFSLLLYGRYSVLIILCVCVSQSACLELLGVRGAHRSPRRECATTGPHCGRLGTRGRTVTHGRTRRYAGCCCCLCVCSVCVSDWLCVFRSGSFGTKSHAIESPLRPKIKATAEGDSSATEEGESFCVVIRAG